MRLKTDLTMLVCFFIAIFTITFAALPALAGQNDKFEIYQASIDKWVPGMLEVRFFEVGKGDASLLHLPDGSFVMIDTGYAETASELTARLKKIGVDKISLLVITHHHKDHAGGLPHLLEAFPVEKVVQAYDRREIGKPLVAPGLRLINSDRIKMTVLGPVRSHLDENEASMVLRLDFASISLLFAADILEESQKDLLNSPARMVANLLKVPHHGRFKGFSPREFFTAVRPEFAIITSDEKAGDPPEGSVVRILKELGARVLLTDECGEIRFLSDGETIDYIPGGKK